MSWLQNHLLGWAVAALPIGTISFAIGQYVKKLSDRVDQQPAAFKTLALIPAIAAAVTALGATLGVPIICQPDTNCLTALDGSTLDAVVKAGLGWIVALITHAGKNGNTKATNGP